MQRHSKNRTKLAQAPAVDGVVPLVGEFVDLIVGVYANPEGAIGTEAVGRHSEKEVDRAARGNGRGIEGIDGSVAEGDGCL